jgi:hypothetical protein
MLQAVFKLAISFSFMFDKQLALSPYIRLSLVFVSGLIAFRRAGFSILIDRYVFYIATFYENFTCWMFFSVACHQLSNYTITTTKLVAIVAAGIFLAGALITMGEKRRQRAFE